jgi:hypothetical protein
MEQKTRTEINLAAALDINTAAQSFGLELVCIQEVCSGGNLNQTYLVTCRDNGQAIDIIFQSVRADIFRIEALNRNFRVVSDHIVGKLSQGDLPTAEIRRRCIVPYSDGSGNTHIQIDGSWWRAFPYPQNTEIFDVLENIDQAKAVGSMVAQFHLWLSDLPVEQLQDPLPNFQETTHYLDQLREALDNDMRARGRILVSPKHIQMWQAIRLELINRNLLHLIHAVSAGEIPLRATHNDPKITNIAFDSKTGLPINLFDWDTIKALPILIDIGDMFRSACSTRSEEAVDFENVQFDLQRFEAMARGYLSIAKDFLTSVELSYFVYSIELLARTLSIRFFLDHLNGNKYFSNIAYPDQNLDKAYNQWALAESIRAQMGDICRIVANLFTELGIESVNFVVMV